MVSVGVDYEGHPSRLSSSSLPPMTAQGNAAAATEEQSAFQRRSRSLPPSLPRSLPPSQPTIRLIVLVKRRRGECCRRRRPCHCASQTSSDIPDLAEGTTATVLVPARFALQMVVRRSSVQGGWACGVRPTVLSRQVQRVRVLRRAHRTSSSQLPKNGVRELRRTLPL